MGGQRDWLVKTEQLQNLLLARATGGLSDDDEYLQLRRELLSERIIKPRLPRFVESCRELSQFWPFIQNKFAHYSERREYIWGEFRPLLDFLEQTLVNPAEELVADSLSKLDRDEVSRIWQRAIQRLVDDPEGAITSARTLLETVCKHILDDSKIPYEEDADLPKLYRLTAERLTLAPSQHSEQFIKQTLGGCQTVVQGLATMRNRYGDAHGKGLNHYRPAPRHAELAVNLAGTMSTFLVETWIARKTEPGVLGRDH